ncbi:DUF1579 domain-containing protein [Parasphingopyxis algicola]|uniref:hypothetical protein n=1 Tax=Parasphingopyxis algicola TaxID=2026624 RepID=UPI0015A212D2|nr:hypothetical protein [Parasphingopyxis algicola]QLC25122.1 DUF1579 domain-containing protein [Parasphingopyxis algicola]
MRQFKSAAFACALVIATGPVFAQQAEDDFAHWFAGEWRGAGTVSGNASRATLDVAPALGGRFLELDYHFTAFAPEGSTTRFAGRGFYRMDGDEAWTGHWFDSSGAVHVLSAVLDGEAWMARWGENGRSEYHRIDADRLEVVDSYRAADGDWTEFARISYTRIED